MSRVEHHEYGDIINLPYRKAKKHIEMPVADRAAQFAPFSALKGYGEAIEETARTTEVRIELDDYEKEKINDRLVAVLPGISDINIIYYVPDEKKTGGQYKSFTGKIKSVKEFEKELITENGDVISTENIISISGAMFDDYL